ncbi:uncharacterized protein K444DRAFT_392482 [Hyaloscypha bicolor E]|uniref:Uncharacterized protein n=1 Tax=Hyaloscypha bicolor E TaxID=1095630 RepID=A0A2J6TBM6_9HELO|nr:uncharacterized protein K444DRAFT_392482 [Hyaloscypha bicolor E]PMD60421.1 hypothetical protein K444DRAFT_392482 [Hyaloscypha bicolor E]
MAQLLVWIAVTFRLPPRSNKLSSSTARFTATSSAFSIQLEQLDELKDSGPGICWTALFPSTVVADGFPVPLVPDMFGLQVPLGIIVELAEIMQDVTLEDDDEADAGTYLDGIRWRLYPTKYDSQENTVQWHLSRKALGEDPNHPSFAEDESAGWLVGVKPETLANATAIVGYCSQVAVQLGTESRLRLYKRYRTSGARFEKPPAEAAPSSATLGGSVLGHLMASITTVLKFKAGLKYSVADIKGMSLKDILDHSAKEPIILFETELGQERGWMVPQLSLIHEAYNYWAFREAKKTGKAIPYAALWDEAVKNAEKEPEPEPEPEGDPDEAKERERRKKAKPIDAEGEIKKIYTAIHNRVVQNAEADEEAGPSVRLGQTPMPGWDWLDLTDSWSVSRRRDARRDGNVFTWKQKPSWLRLTRYVPVFLGRGMEQVIVPVGASAELVCGQWQPVPGGFKRNYLVAYVECLRSLAEKNGNLDVWRLIDDIAWKFTDAELFEPCKQACLADRTKCPKQPQHLCKRKGDKKKSDTLPAPGVGAVIFGAKRKSEKQLTKMPAAVGEEEEEDEEEAVVEAVAEEEDEEAEVEAVAEAELEEEGEGEDGPPVPAAPGIPINHEDPAGRELVAAVGIAEALGDPLLPFGDEGALPVPSPVPPNPGNGQERRRKLADNVHIFDDEDDAPPAPENVQVNNRKPVVDAQVENQDDVPQAQEKVRANNRKPTTGAQVFDNHDDALPVPGNVQVNKRNLVDAQVLDGKDDALLAPGNDQENDRKLAADARVFGNKDSAAADPALKVDAQESQPVVTIQVLMLQCEGVGRWLHDNWHLLVITILIALLVRKYTE